jgi:hypothetical protein
MLRNQKEKLSDEQFIVLLEKNAAKSVANVVRNWDRDTQK